MEVKISGKVETTNKVWFNRLTLKQYKVKTV